MFTITKIMQAIIVTISKKTYIHLDFINSYLNFKSAKCNDSLLYTVFRFLLKRYFILWFDLFNRKNHMKKIIF